MFTVAGTSVAGATTNGSGVASRPYDAVGNRCRRRSLIREDPRLKSG